jgi:hypothetical protein
MGIQSILEPRNPSAYVQKSPFGLSLAPTCITLSVDDDDDDDSDDDDDDDGDDDDDDDDRRLVLILMFTLVMSVLSMISPICGIALPNCSLSNSNPDSLIPVTHNDRAPLLTADTASDTSLTNTTTPKSYKEYEDKYVHL